MSQRKLKKEVSILAVLAVGTGSWVACRGHSGVPADLTPAATRTSDESPLRKDALVWGNWHAVPWDEEVAAFLERAHRLQTRGERETAIAALNSGLERHPDSAALLEARGALYASLGYRRAAERDFEHVLEHEPASAGTWVALGRMREELGLAKSALEALDRGADLGATGSDLHLACARARRDLGEISGAARHYVLALEETGHPPFELLVEAATLYFESEEVSLTEIDRALMAVSLPENPEAERQVWLVRDLLRDLSGVEPERIAAGLHALGIQEASLRAWTDLSLTSLCFAEPVPRSRGKALVRGPDSAN